MSRTVERIWAGRSGWAIVVRAALEPAGLLYGGITGLRNALYDRGVLRATPPPMPTVSVGNLTVGGTGKTPVAAWMAGELARRGARPAVVLRGHGGDEPHVHTVLNPGVGVIVDPDRVRALRHAAASGHDVAVLDDGFQHRRAGRTADVVLVSADSWSEPLRLLPAGPWRESLAGLRRATAIVVTRKATSGADASALMRRLTPRTQGGLGVVVRLGLGPLSDFVGGGSLPLDALRGKSILVAAGIGNPAALSAQLTELGARVTERRFPDHHVYTPSDTRILATEGTQYDVFLCTLKDAVKLGPLWPRGAGPLWYVSQRVELEEGSAGLLALLDHLVDART
jgi:tetraacyldisaccharide 4'-kinase